MKVFLPYGISFYTFQSLSYSLEVYRKKLPAERSFLNLAFFIAFFAAATVVAGLGIAGGFVQAAVVEDVMQPVVDIEQVDDRGLADRGIRWIGIGADRVVEARRCSQRGAHIVGARLVAVGQGRGQRCAEQQAGIEIGIGVVAGGGGGTGRQPGIAGRDRAGIQAHQIDRKSVV